MTSSSCPASCARASEPLAERAPQLAARVHWLDTLPAHFDGVVVGNGCWMRCRCACSRARTGASVAWHVTPTDVPGFAFSDRMLAPDEVARLLALAGTHDVVTETHAEAEGFVRAIGAMLSRGAAFFVDYGFPAAEYYHPQRAEGTLMCHYRHHAHPDPFLYPGLQDITAHVNFSGIAHAGVDAGLEVAGFASQARFLMNAGITELLMALDPSDVNRFLPAANGVQKLLSEAEMGELFKVIALTRGLQDLPAARPLAGFARGDRSHAL